MGVLVLPMRVPPPLFSACSARRKRNRPAVGYPPYVAALRSVAHLTFVNPFWHPVQTRSVS
ncbi:MAG: hypothetical protein LBQ66_15970 [Planctomycetaceae bacterium]|nr:hypothetical protein [Planctomycetaceae bacterium]